MHLYDFVKVIYVLYNIILHNYKEERYFGCKLNRLTNSDESNSYPYLQLNWAFRFSAEDRCIIHDFNFNNFYDKNTQFILFYQNNISSGFRVCPLEKKGLAISIFDDIYIDIITQVLVKIATEDKILLEIRYENDFEYINEIWI